MYVEDTMWATLGSSIRWGGSEALGPGVNRNEAELESALRESYVRSHGTRVTDGGTGGGPAGRSPIAGSVFGGPGMPSKLLREGCRQRS